METRDNGALLRSHRRGVMPRAAHNFRFFADWLGELDAGDLEIYGHRQQVTWAPSGVTAVITPWNAPLMLATWRIAPALAAGNTVIAKPPEWAPLTASLLADIARDGRAARRRPQRRAGPRRGSGRAAGRASRPGEGLASPARSRPAASLPPRPARSSPRSRSNWAASPRCSFSLMPTWTWPSAPPSASTTTPGRSAWPGTRLLVDERSPTSSPSASSTAPRPCGRATPETTPPTSGRTSPGRTCNGSTASSGARWPPVRARCSAAGRNGDLGGLYYRPTLLTGAAPGSEILTEEVFGPVLTLQTFSGEDEAVALANSTRYGLAATMFTGDQRPRRAGVGASGRGNRLGQLLLRPRPAGAVRRHRAVRDRPGGRHLELRLLRRRQEHRLRPGGLAAAMGEVVGAGLLAHVPTIMLPREDRLDSTRARRSAWSPGWNGCAPRSSRCSTTTRSWSSTRTGSPRWSSLSPPTTPGPACSPPMSFRAVCAGSPMTGGATPSLRTLWQHSAKSTAPG